jgi:hypothetical protein
VGRGEAEERVMKSVTRKLLLNITKRIGFWGR